MRRGTKPGAYLVYKGDEFIAVGTVKEISEITGLKESTIYQYASPTWKKLRQDIPEEERLIVERLEDE